MHHNKKNNGFTLIELMLAMTFVAFILVFMSLTLVQMLRTYDKGVSMKQINQAGRSIVDDISQSIRSQLPGDIDTTNVAGGTLCVGSTMYVWNPLYAGTALNGSTTVNPSRNTVEGDATTGGMMARKKLVNPSDTCDNSSPVSESSMMLSSRARVLWANVTPSPDGRLVKIVFALGTYDRDELQNSTEAQKLVSGPYDNFYITPHLEGPAAGKHFSCLPGNNGNYCAFSEFSTIVYLSKEQ